MHIHQAPRELLPQFPGSVGWFAVSTRSRQEKAVALRLDAARITNFLPLAKETRQWSDRKKVIEVPLFDGYIFVLIDPLQKEKLAILNTPGVVRFIGNQKGPLLIPDAQIESLRTILAMRVEVEPHAYLNVGDRVRVVRGMLAGVEGTLIRSSSDTRIVVSIETIRRSISLEISSRDVELLSPHSEQALPTVSPN